RLRQTEVEDLHRTVGGDFDVGRFQITVNDALLMRSFESFGYLPRELQRFFQGNRAVLQSIGQGLAFDEFKYQETCASIFVQSMNRCDVRMVERRKQLRFAFKPRQPVWLQIETLR